MRFPTKKPVVGHKVPENAADVAATLDVPWRASDVHEGEEVAHFDGHRLRAAPTGHWYARHANASALDGADGLAADLAGAKRAATLSLARDLCEQRAPKPVCTIADEIVGTGKCATPEEAAAMSGYFRMRYDLATATDADGTTDAARARLVDALAKAPTPDPREVAKIVVGRAFKIGDRVRVKEDAAKEWMAFRDSRDGIIERVVAPFFYVRECALYADEIEHVDVEHAPAVAFEWDQGECFVDGFLLLAFGDGSWGVRKNGGCVADCAWPITGAPAHFHGKSREECLAMARAECEAAFLALPKR